MEWWIKVINRRAVSIRSNIPHVATCYFIYPPPWKIIHIGGRIHSINLESRQYFVDEGDTRPLKVCWEGAFTYSHACTRIPIGTQYSGTYGNIATRIGESRGRTTCNRVIVERTRARYVRIESWTNLNIVGSRGRSIYHPCCSKLCI